MPSDPTQPSGPPPANADDLAFGTYSSPPCFLHELDPSYLGLTDPPVAEPQAKAAGGAGQAPDDAAMPDGPRASSLLRGDAEDIAPSGISLDGASACRSPDVPSPHAGPIAPSR